MRDYGFKMKPTKTNLFKKGKQMGFKNDQDVIDTIKVAGINGSFNPAHWEDYIGALLREKIRRSVESEAKVDEANSLVYNFKDDPCPVCQALRLRNTELDNQFGVAFGWTCTKDNSHFFQHQCEHIKSGLVGRTDTMQFGYEDDREA